VVAVEELLRVAVAEAQGQFGNPQEAECLPMEVVTRTLVKAMDDGH
jgi:hypothetical protein